MFRKLNIKNLLFYWSIICSVVIIILSLILIFSNKHITEKQNAVVEKTVLIQESSRGITKVVGDFILRQSHIMSITKSNDLENIQGRKQLETIFEYDIANIRNLVLDDVEGRLVVNDLEKHYKQFLKYDELISDDKHQILRLEKELEKKTNQLEDLVTDILHVTENVTGIINLDNSREKRKIRALASNIENNQDQIYDFLESAYFGGQPRIVKASYEVQQNVSGAVQLSRKIIQEQDKDVLIDIRDNQVEQCISQIYTALGWLENDLKNYPDLLIKIKNLHSSID